jgi:hypothetical protein
MPRRPRRRLRPLALAVPLALAALAAAPPAARAFCGFYVAGADQKLFNNATAVVLMREGTRTVLSMQNNYQGPPEGFAMVVPVPVVLQKENVKTLPDEVFDRVDRLAAPRLVEYWEQDPCAPPEPMKDMAARPGAARAAGAPAGGGGLGVRIEAQFKVGEYDIVVLSAGDSMGLDTWLRQNGYKIPEGAEPILRPYVQGGMKFFVAKVDVSKVRFEKGMARLSPLRFHYDADTFNLPVRLGLVNSSGKQDLIVHILARGQRYELANYKNVTIPTNLDIDERARDQFGAFYAALFDRTLEENPGAVVTEYAWDAGSCDPCPSPGLTPAEIATLGGDVLVDPEDGPFGPPPGVAPPPSPPSKPGPAPRPGGGRPPPPGVVPGRPAMVWRGGFVLTRLHARYGKESLGEDLVFRAVKPIWGGREARGADGKLETGATLGSVNNFQGRYAIRHPWTGPIACSNPVRGVWGGPPGGGGDAPPPRPAQDLAFAPRGGVQLASLVRQDVPEIHLKADLPLILPAPPPPAQGVDTPQPAPLPDEKTPRAQETGGCGACAATRDPGLARGAALALAALAAALAARARRRR